MTGRSLTLAGSTLLTSTLTAGAVPPNVDLIVLAEYAMIDEQTDLLQQLGFTRVEVMPTPEATLTATLTTTVSATVTVAVTEIPPLTPTVTPTTTVPAAEEDPSQANVGNDIVGTRATGNHSVAEISAGVQITPVEPLTPTKSLTGTITPQVTGTPETPTPTSTPPTPAATPAPTQAPTVYLEKADGLRLVARQTVIIAQLSLGGQHRLVAVLGHDNAGIQNGVERLMSGDYTGCLTGADLVVCSFEGSSETASTSAPPQPNATPTAAVPSDATPTSTPMSPEPVIPEPVNPEPVHPEVNTSILVVDDNDTANPNNPNEADIYLLALTQAGYTPSLWVTADQDAPPIEELSKYRWVIWSSGGYENGGPGVNDLDVLLNFINKGGWLTISSRRPFFAMSTEDASVIVDVAIDDDIPELVAGLPPEVTELANGLAARDTVGGQRWH